MSRLRMFILQRGTMEPSLQKELFYTRIPYLRGFRIPRVFMENAALKAAAFGYFKGFLFDANSPSCSNSCAFYADNVLRRIKVCKAKSI